MYDLLIKGGTVIDPSQGIHGVNDVAVENGKIARVAPQHTHRRGQPRC